MSSKPSLGPAAQQIIDRHDHYMSINYGRYPIVMERGKGSYLYDSEGREYLDLFAGFGAGLLGHCHPDVVQAVVDQAHKLWHPGNLYHTEPQTLLAQSLSTMGFGGRSYFCHSGADANESALKLSRLFGKANPGSEGPRFEVISTSRSFHGRSFGTMMATGQEKVRAGFDPFLPGFMQVPYNDLPAMEAAITPRTVAIIVEPIQGEGGINVPSDDYLPGLRALCDKHQLLLIMDEVWTGIGRTGKNFAHQHWGITPDIMTLAKGVGGGLPVGVMCARPEIADYFNHQRYGGAIHATTLGGNCLSMAAGAAVCRVIERDGLAARAQQLGQRAMDRLRRLASATPMVQDVRGKGLFIGVELNAHSRESWFDSIKQVVQKCLDKGLIVNGTQNNVLRLAPPITITEQELDRGLELLEKVLIG